MFDDAGVNDNDAQFVCAMRGLFRVRISGGCFDLCV